MLPGQKSIASFTTKWNCTRSRSPVVTPPATVRRNITCFFESVRDSGTPAPGLTPPATMAGIVEKPPNENGAFSSLPGMMALGLKSNQVSGSRPQPQLPGRFFSMIAASSR